MAVKKTTKNEATESALGSENMPSAGHWIQAVQAECAIYLKSFKNTRKKLRHNPRENAVDNSGLWHC